MGQISLLRWMQLVTAILGLVFASSGPYVYGLVVFAFVLALIYMIVVFVSSCANRDVFSGRAQTVVEIVIAMVLLIITIYCTLDYGKDALFILALICGYVLPAMLFITAYTGH